MKWLGDPPCIELELVSLHGGRLELRGPRTGDRVENVAHAVGGGVLTRLALGAVASGGLLAAGLAATGVGLAAAAGAKALAQVVVTAEPSRGVTCSWKVVGRKARQRRFEVGDIDRVELRRESLRVDFLASRDEVDDPLHLKPLPARPCRWRVVLVLERGAPVEIELIEAEDEARQRQRQLEEILAAGRRLQARRETRARGQAPPPVAEPPLELDLERVDPEMRARLGMPATMQPDTGEPGRKRRSRRKS